MAYAKTSAAHREKPAALKLTQSDVNGKISINVPLCKRRKRK